MLAGFMLGRWIFLALAFALAEGKSMAAPTSSPPALPPPAPLVVPLWNGPAPLAHGSGPADTPTLSVYLAPGPGPHAAVVIFPGGGYGYLSIDFEGAHIARWFQSRGVSAFVLQYRIPKQGYRYPAPYLDAQRALRLVRARAAAWHLDPRHLGVIGFSAGGHLAGLLATAPDPGDAAAPDPIDRFSDRPDFVVLAYPVVTMLTAAPHSRSRANLLGPHPDPRLAAELSIDRRVTAKMPPTLLLYADDDPIVPPGPNSVVLAAALTRAHVPHRVIAYPTGGHGWGLGHHPERGPAHWLDAVQAWLAEQGVVLTPR